MSVVEQLSLVANFFLLKHSEIVVPAASTRKLCDNDNTRVYLAFTCNTSAGPINIAWFSNPTLNSGFPFAAGTFILELWIEKHKSLLSQPWFCLNTGGSSVTIEVIEVCYAFPEKINEDSVNGNKT